ncbi:MAG: hypothetical protein PHS17_12460 [Desulfobacterales bacterium]|nr:hypothetical protein [Desulfobacterales bacterium]
MAAKKQSKSKKKLRRRLRLQEQASRAEFLEKIKRTSIATGREIRIDPPGQVKMSGVILDFAAPLLERFEHDTSAENLIALAVLAWNLSLVPEEKHGRRLDEMAEKLSLDGEASEEMNDIMEWLLDRKRKHFAEHARYIVDYRLYETDNQRGLQVVSTIAP